MQSENFYNFFGFNTKHNFPPKPIRYTEEYKGSNIVNILCTQTELSQSNQSKLIKEWCEILPKLDTIKYILFFSKVPQKLFDAICSMSNIEGIYIKWSGIQKLENIKNLTKLKYLHIGSSAQIKSITPLKQLNQLKWLELENFKQISDLSSISTLTKLEGLAITGGFGSDQKITSLKPIIEIKSLRWLNLIGTRVKDESLEPITKLKHLKYLRLSYYFSVEEMARIVAKLKATNHGVSAYLSLEDSICNKCGNDTLIIPTGKGKRSFCPTCHPKKLIKLVDDFQRHVEIYT